MSGNYLIEQLNNIDNAKRDNRQRVANIVCNNHDLIPHLVGLTFEIDDKVSIKTA